MASKLIAPYLFGWLSDHLEKRLIIIQITMLLSVITFAGVLPYHSYWWYVAVMAFFGFFWNASLPLYESLTLSYLDGNSHRYSHIRLWGSVGFILIVVSLSFFINQKTDHDYISFLPIIMLSLLIANALSTLLVKDKIGHSIHNSTIKLSLILKSPIVIAFLLVCALQTMSHGTYYTFFSIYLEEHHYSRNMIGVFWALGVLAEVALFIVVHQFFARLGVCKLFVLALFLTSFRWLILAFWVDNLAILLISQLIHAASFGLFHATAIDLTHQFFPGKLHGRGQALYAGLSFGLGGAIGNWLSGHSWDSIGSTWSFLTSAIIALIGAIIALKYIRKEHLPAYARKP